MPEAYANFGYLGIAGLAIVLAIFYGFITNLTVGVPMTSLRFVLGLLIMAAATRADTMGVFITTQFQGVVGVSLAAMVLMRRQGNPFAAGGGEGIRHTGNGMRRAAYGIRQTAYGRRQEPKGIRHTANGIRQGAEGMPAAGVLTGLIEGAQPEAGGGQGTGNRGQETEGRRQEAGPVEYAGPVKLSSDSATAGAEHSTGRESKQLAADGGVVRTLPIRTPKRIASWMPRRVRAAVVAQQQTAAEGVTEGASVGQKDGVSVEPSGSESQPESAAADGDRLHGNQLIRVGERPRQVAVPYRNYRRYRSG